MPRLQLALVVVAVCLSGCFNPDYSKVLYTCTYEEPVCQDGYVCDGAHCVLPVAPVADLASPDGPPAPDMAPRNGCASGKGAAVGASAWACPGLYEPGTVRAMCASGFAICKSAAGINLAECRNITGFFIADVRGYDSFKECPSDAAAVTCGYIDNRERPLWFGCGSLTGYNQICKKGCAGFVQANNGTLAARVPGPPFVDSFTDDIDAQTNNERMNGVLCCAQ